MPPVWKIYEWADGTYVNMVFDFPRFYFLPSFRNGEKCRISTNGRLHHGEDVYRHLPPSKWEVKKHLGWLTDMGFSNDPKNQIDTICVTSSLTGEHRDLYRYPRWIEDSEWESRFDEFESITGYFLCLEGVRTKVSPHDKIFNVRWWTETPHQGSFTLEMKGDSPSPEEKRKAIDLLCEKELLLPMAEREEWESDHLEKGRFLIPSPEEVEMYRLLDEPLPFFWDPTELLKWILARQE